jgi:hypothetical protein
MKWYKHMTDSRRSPFELQVRRELKRDGLLTWRLLVETLAQRTEWADCSVKLHIADWLDEVSLPRNAKASLLRLLRLAHDHNEVIVAVTGDYVAVHMPKLLELRDEYSKKLRRKSGSAPDQIQKEIHTQRSEAEPEDTQKKKETQRQMGGVGGRDLESAINRIRARATADSPVSNDPFRLDELP